MRSLLLLSIAALPLAASAQARNITSLPPETTMTVAIHSATGAGAGPIHMTAPLHEIIRTVVAPDFATNTSDDSDLQTSFGEPNQIVEPTLTQWTALKVPQQDVAQFKQPAQVAVKMIVNLAGKPELLQIAKSATPELDALALASVKNYRFSPAEVDHVPVDAPVTVTITLGE